MSVFVLLTFPFSFIHCQVLHHTMWLVPQPRASCDSLHDYGCMTALCISSHFDSPSTFKNHFLHHSGFVPFTDVMLIATTPSRSFSDDTGLRCSASPCFSHCLVIPSLTSSSQSEYKSSSIPNSQAASYTEKSIRLSQNQFSFKLCINK